MVAHNTRRLFVADDFAQVKIPQRRHQNPANQRHARYAHKTPNQRRFYWGGEIHKVFRKI